MPAIPLSLWLIGGGVLAVVVMGPSIAKKLVQALFMGFEEFINRVKIPLEDTLDLISGSIKDWRERQASQSEMLPVLKTWVANVKRIFKEMNARTPMYMLSSEFMALSTYVSSVADMTKWKWWIQHPYTTTTNLAKKFVEEAKTKKLPIIHDKDLALFALAEKLKDGMTWTPAEVAWVKSNIRDGKNWYAQSPVLLAKEWKRKFHLLSERAVPLAEKLLAKNEEKAKA
jgi:hypothetical protein